MPIAPPSQRIDLAVFIGRFQPFTLAHLSVVRAGLAAADHVCVVIGSAAGPRSHRNPFNFQERRDMILACLSEDERKRIAPIHVDDHLYDETRWLEAVQVGVGRVARALAGGKPRISLIGFSKDATGYYLKSFPLWGSIEAPNFRDLSATPIRETYFAKGGAAAMDANAHLPEPVRLMLRNFAGSAAFTELVREYDFVRDYRRQWGPGPFVTTDACVLQSGNILLMKRRGRPGKGLWAMPGGFLDIPRHETLLDCALRELTEETSIDVAPAALRGSVIHAEVFDAPFRDPRARIITHAYLIDLPARTGLPKVRAQESEAEGVAWLPLADLHEDHLFADHIHIIRKLRGHLPKQPK